MNVPFVGRVTDRGPVPVYGEVPPVAETVQVNGLPAVRPVFGQSTVTTSGWAAMVTESLPDAVTALASVTLKLWVNVPLVGWVADRVPVPVYGAVPPVADTVQLNGLPAVSPVFGQSTVTTRGWAPMVTGSLPEAVTPLASVTLKLWLKLPLVG